MLQKICLLIKKCYANNVLRYIFFGGLTTLVNLVMYYLLSRCIGINITVSNTLSVIVAVLFAFIVNSKFVFQSKAKGLKAHFKELMKFVGARLSTMVIEVGGVWLLVEVLSMNDLFVKFIIQFIVMALNYIFSKFLVFTRK